MKRMICMAVAGMLTAVVSAQDTYETARVLGSDLNGTARYVSMGGAMEALGADISTISSNPAGIGLFRHSTANVSFGMVSQQDAQRFDGLNKTNMSFDQAGFVYSAKVSPTSFVNFAFNYHKSRNFDQLLSAANLLGGASLNKLTYMKASLENSTLGGFYLDNVGSENNPEWMGFMDYSSDLPSLNYSQLDYLMANVMMQEPGDLDHFVYYDGNSFDFNRAHRGWIADFDFNLSGNINDRVYLGVTVGLHNVNYKGYTAYTETLVDVLGSALGNVLLTDNRELSGSGVDVKVGAIFRPIETSPFRIGLYVNSPTWYSLETSNHVEVLNLSKGGLRDTGWNNDGYETYEFKFYTPWKFGVSIGHTIGNFLALGATYEYTDYSSADIRKELPYYDDYGQLESESDRVMNQNVESSLKGASTVKVGMEFKPAPSVAVRFGYNYVSPMYSNNGMRNSHLESYGVYYASTSDYTNWNDTHRLTCGLGYKVGHFNVDLAYQYSMTSGDFYPMQKEVYYLDTNNNLAINSNFVMPTKVDFKRHQLLLTMGYTF